MQAEGLRKTHTPAAVQGAQNALYGALCDTFELFKAAAAELRAVSVKTIAFVTAAVVAVTATSAASAVYTIGFDVYYNGKNIATIERVSDYERAVADANSALYSIGASAVGTDVSLMLRIAPRASLTPNAPMARALMLSSEGVCEGYTLYADGAPLYTTRTAEECEGALADFASKFTDGDVTYNVDTSIVSEACKDESIVSRTRALEILNSTDALRVLYSIKSYSESTVPFETVYIDDDTMYKGMEKVETEGVDGKARTAHYSNYENDTLIDESVGESETVTESVAAVIRRGTKLGVSEGRGFPASGTVTSRFGSRWGRAHQGIDIGADIGESVYAYSSGKVIMAQYYYGYGNYIKIDHGNGFVTAYAHLNSMAVKEGDTITGGQYIGAVGNTGSSTGPHLHFEVIVNGTHVDPEPYISR